MDADGYYKSDYRALNLRELVRLRGLPGLPFAFLFTRLKSRQTPEGWMPNLWADLACSEQDLSARFFQAVSQSRQALKGLGFSEVGFAKTKRHLNPIFRDSGKINFLSSDRRHFGQLIYTRVHAPKPIDADREQIAIAFTAVFERRTLSSTNLKFGFDSLPQHEVLRRPSLDVTAMYRAFCDHLGASPEQPRCFSDISALQAWFDSNAREVFQAQVARGLYVRMSESEVEDALRKLAAQS